MKMGIACLTTIRLRFGTKAAFDSFTYKQQYCGWVAHWLAEHHQPNPVIAFVKPQMVGQ